MSGQYKSRREQAFHLHFQDVYFLAAGAKRVYVLPESLQICPFPPTALDQIGDSSVK